MKWVAVASALVLAIAWVGFGQSETGKPNPGSNDEQPIRRVLEEFRNAVFKSDASAADHLLAKDFVITLQSGVSENKIQILARIAKNKFESLIWDDVNVRVYGDTAVVTFRAIRNLEGRDDRPIRVLAVFVKENGEWKIVAQQGTYMAQ